MDEKDKDIKENRVKKFSELDSPEFEKKIVKIVEQYERSEALNEVIDALLEAVDYLLQRVHNLTVDNIVMQVRYARMEKRIGELEEELKAHNNPFINPAVPFDRENGTFGKESDGIKWYKEPTTTDGKVKK